MKMNVKIKFANIRVRLTLWFVLLVVLILISFGGLVYLILDQRLDQQLDDKLHSVAAQAREVIVTGKNGDLELKQELQNNELFSFEEQNYLLFLVNQKGSVLTRIGTLSKLDLPLADITTPVLSSRQPQFNNVKTTGPESPLRVYTIPVDQNGTIIGVLVVGQSLRSVQDTLHLLLWILGLVLPVMVIVTGASGLFLANRALAPIDQITRTAQRIGAEDLSKRLNTILPERDDEVGRLAKTFDAMLQRLEEAFNRQRQFTADASHELRTPLAIMKGNIGVALNRPREASEYQAVLLNLEEEVDSLTRLVNDLLLLARADSGQPLLHLESFNLNDLLRVVAEQLRPLAQEKGLQIELNLANLPEIEIDVNKLLRLFLNLLENAIKFTPSGGQIKICTELINPTHQNQNQGWIKIAIIDNGYGMAPQHLTHIFERFYRVDEARTHTVGGTGLGLPLASWITTAHGGKIEVFSQEGKGSTFWVWLPLNIQS